MTHLHARTQRSNRAPPLNALIDKALGCAEDDEYMTEFVDWVTKNHWGENYAPEKWLRAQQKDRA